MMRSLPLCCVLVTFFYNINTQEELHTQKRMQFDKVLITMGITLESSKIKISIVIALAILHLLCTF